MGIFSKKHKHLYYIISLALPNLIIDFRLMLKTMVSLNILGLRVMKDRRDVIFLANLCKYQSKRQKYTKIFEIYYVFTALVHDLFYCVQLDNIYQSTPPHPLPTIHGIRCAFI